MLALDGVGKRYGRTWALRDVDARLERGERVGLVGPNASGKTTLLDILSGLTRPDAGRLSFRGRPVGEDRVGLKAAVGYVRHDPGLYERLTVRENLVFAARARGLDPKASRMEELVDRLGLRARVEDRVAELSRGLGQRAALAFALVHDPAVVLMDEPFTGLDPDARRRLLDLLRAEDDGDRLIVATAHSVDDVPGARRVLVLDEGRVAFDGAPDRALKEQPSVRGVVG